MSSRSVLLVALALTAAPLAAGTSDAVRRAEGCWARRAEGFDATGRVDPEPARCAAESWQAALRAEPERLDLAFREIEADWFLAHFATPESRDRRRLLDRAVAVAERAVDEAEREDPARAGEAHFWATIAWGEWGSERGWLASAARGVPGRLREHAEAAAREAPNLRDGGGLRLLGRLHAVLPRLPWVTGWVDRARGRDLLRRALEVSRDDPRNLLFLAEALLDAGAEHRGEAIALLREAVARSPAPGEIVEQSETLAAARERLRQVEER